MKRRIFSVLATLALACGLLLTNPGTAQAAPHHHNTLPYPSSCGANTAVISRQVSAPGSTPVDGWIWAGGQGWDFHCEWTCTRYA